MRRESFETLAQWEVVLFYLLIPVTLAVFAFGAYRLIRKYRAGRGETRFDFAMRRLVGVARGVFDHSSISRRDTTAGMSHLAIFYGFIALLIATTILAVNDDLLKHFLGIDLWRGAFYLAYSFLADIFGLALVVGLIVLVAKRARRPARLDYARPEGTRETIDRRLYVIGDWVFIGSLLYLGISGFIIEALRIAVTNPDYEIWSPVGWILSRVLQAVGVVSIDDATNQARNILWWLHSGAALVFVAVIPYTKAVHMMTAPANLVARDDHGTNVLPEVPADATAEQVGYSRLIDFSPSHLLSLDACTKCGKCHVACPALASGSPLSPRDLVLDLRECAEGAMGIRAALHVPPLYGAAASILGDPIRSETLWSCTTCMACVEICPVGIEHVPVINQLRRRLIEMGEIDPQLQTTLGAIASTGNSFGEPRRKRAKWAKGLPVQLKDARQEACDVLWFVGDYAALDPRAQQATTKLASVFQAAGVDLGILYEGETSAGCDVRRVGEEGLFMSLAKGNIRTLAACDYQRIVTSDAHTFHTLSKEYPRLGLKQPVLHHTQLLADLLESRTIIPKRRLGYTATYHDPCYLGRYGKVFDPPREVLTAIGVEIHEMPRNRDNSFCCGAGGGVIWMKEMERAAGVARPAEQRITEALELGDAQRFVVACPKDLVMYSAAATNLGCDDRLIVTDIAELVAEALGLGSEDAQTDEVVTA